MSPRKPFLFLHADDFGMTPQSCERILECRSAGHLNSISILPNGCLSYALDKLKTARIPYCSIHINLVEGKALSAKGKAKLLVNPNGYFKNSFLGLFLLSLSPRRKEFQKQVYGEIKAQLLTVTKLLPPGQPIRLDSHQHTHMIPLIFHTMLQVCQDLKLSVSYIRIPAEPLHPFLRKTACYKTYSPVNLLKNILLNLCWLFDRKAFLASGISTSLFCGILFSGHMDSARVKSVLPCFYRTAAKRGMDLELLFHPGYIRPGEDFLDPYKTSFQKFYLSPNRKIEKKTLQQLNFHAIISDSRKGKHHV